MAVKRVGQPGFADGWLAGRVGANARLDRLVRAKASAQITMVAIAFNLRRWTRIAPA